MNGEAMQYGRIELPRATTAYVCSYCGRADPADRNQRCQGCGVHKRSLRQIDVTTLRDTDRQYVYVEE